MKKLKNQRGFTLIELIIVVAILGVLSALIIPRITGNINDAKKSTDYANALNIAKQIELAFAQGDLDLATIDTENGSKADSTIDESLDLTSNGTDYKCVAKQLLDKGYLDIIPESKVTDEPFKLNIVFNEADDQIKSIKIEDGKNTIYPK